MTQFASAHATHPNWQACVELVLAQLGSEPRKAAPGMALLGLAYVTDHFSASTPGIVELLRQRLPHVGAFAGAVGVGVCGNNAEYIDEPAVSLMLAELPEGSFQVFNGLSPLGKFAATTALVHAEGGEPDLAELIAELAGRTESGQVFGGLALSRMVRNASAPESTAYQIAVRSDSQHAGVFTGGLSGVAFSQAATVLARVTHGCQAVAPSRQVTACFRNVVRTLDSQPALSALLRDASLPADALTGDESTAAILKLQRMLVAIDEPATGKKPSKTNSFTPQTRVRHLLGIDPPTGAVAVAERLEVGQQLAFCVRSVDAGRKDLVRVCTELREALEPQELSDENSLQAPASHIRGAVYVSCAGRGGPHFGGPNAELQLIARALGDVPLVGFFAGGEIAHQQVHSYTGVLLVFSEAALEGA